MVRIVGFRESVRALNKFPTDLQRDTRREINRAVLDTVKVARGYVPADPAMSGWDKANYAEGSRWYDRGYNATEIRRGLRVYRGSGKSANHRGWYTAIGAENRSAAGMIYELAGSKSAGRTPAGRRFIRNIASTGLRTPLRRLIVRAGVEEGSKATARILAALRRLEASTNRVTA